MRRVLPALLVYFLAMILLGLVLSPPVYWAVDHFWPGHVPFKRVFNRTLMISAFVLLWPLLSYLRISSLRAWGLDFRRQALCSFWPWAILGLGTLALLVCGQILTGAVIWQPALKWSQLLTYALSGLLVGLLEEPMFRGVFFLAFIKQGRVLRNVSLACLSSIFFATAHFIKAQNPSLPVTWGSGLDVWREIGTHLANPQEFFMNWFTLLLVGLVLCALVWRQGQVWGAAGLHAGWVLALKCSGRLGEAGVPRYPHWFTTNVLSGLGADVLLLVLLVLLICWPGNVREYERVDRKSS